MESKAVENVTEAAINLAHLTHEVSKAKVLMGDAFEDGKRKAGRMITRGVVAAEDCVEDTTYFIKRHPWQSIAVALGLGAAVGIFTGWLTARSWARTCQN